MILQASLLLLAIFILYIGAEFALESSEKIGKVLRIPSLVVGLLLVGLGTSLPEFFVSHLAALRGSPGIAMGNIVGSNIGNLFMILGITAFMVPVHLTHKTIRVQLWLHLALTVLLSIVLSFDQLYPFSGIALFTFFLYYLFHTYLGMRNKRDHYTHEEAEEIQHIIKDNWAKIKLFGTLLIGFFFLYAGGELLVSSGTKLGKMAGISDYVISAIFVAFGTSFPELVTSILACIKKKDVNLILGNIIGSNVFNVAFVLGTLGLHYVPYGRSFKFEIACLLFGGIYLIILSKLNKDFKKLSGALYFGIYLGIVAYWTGLF